MLACSIAWGAGVSAYDQIDPHTAYVTWSDGLTERWPTVVRAECDELLAALRSRPPRLVPYGREGLTVVGFTCSYENSRPRGWGCIQGHNC